MVKGHIIVNKELCKECLLCVSACPKGMLAPSPEFNLKGYHPVCFKNTGECTACTTCALMCPEVAIEVYRD